MADVVVDASVIIKWVVEEAGSGDAVGLLDAGYTLCAPDLLIPECANILWKKVRRGDLKLDEANAMAGLLKRAAVELVPTRSLLVDAFRIAHALDHPAYDGFYVSLAIGRSIPLVTADERLVRRIAEQGSNAMRQAVVPLTGWKDRVPKRSNSV